LPFADSSDPALSSHADAPTISGVAKIFAEKSVAGIL